MKPHYFLLSSAILFLLASFLISPFDLTLNIVDTYFIIPVTHFLRCSAVGLLLFAAFYKRFNHYLISKMLTWIHVLSLLLFPLIIALMSYSFNKSLAVVEISDQGTSSFFGRHHRTNYIILSTLIVMQILPVLNIIFGVMNRHKRNIK